MSIEHRLYLRWFINLADLLIKVKATPFFSAVFATPCYRVMLILDSCRGSRVVLRFLQLVDLEIKILWLLFCSYPSICLFFSKNESYFVGIIRLLRQAFLGENWRLVCQSTECRQIMHWLNYCSCEKLYQNVK